ncbi:MAG: MTAP family purine nucleoside phosphorylase [Pseudonocardiales bacterium]
MRVGIVSGSGSYDWPRLDDPRPHTCRTRWGSAEVTFGQVAGVDVVHLARHGAGHAALSNQIDHRANLAALLDCGIDVLVSLSVCGAVDPTLELGSVVVFDDLHFPGNRLPDGTACTWYDTVGEKGRGHWIFDSPFSPALRHVMLDAASDDEASVVDGGCYGHVDGPRFNSRAEIAALACVGVSAVSQTAGPEVVLAGEAELPVVLLGYLTDYANGVTVDPQPVDALIARMRASTETFARILELALPRMAAAGPPAAAGVVYRFDS